VSGTLELDTVGAVRILNRLSISSVGNVSLRPEIRVKMSLVNALGNGCLVFRVSEEKQGEENREKYFLAVLSNPTIHVHRFGQSYRPEKSGLVSYNSDRAGQSVSK
jgi:hypothetical protein